MMQPPRKRRRLFESGDPDAELFERRARNDKKLKSIFESIFEKYGRDFTGVGDIIDFQKEKILVNNGHIEDMADEKDIGIEDELSPGEEDVLSDDEVDEKQYERVVPDSQDVESSDDDDPLGMLEDAISTTASRMRQWGQTPLSQNPSGHLEYGRTSTFRPLTALQQSRYNPWVEEAWRVPLLPADVNAQRALPSPSPSVEDESDSSRSASPSGVSIWALPKRTSQSKAFEPLASHPSYSAQSKSSAAVSKSWTPEEKQLLRQMKGSGKPWAEISKQFPNRTTGAIQIQWSTLQKKSDQALFEKSSLQSDKSLLPRLEKAGHEHSVRTKHTSDHQLQTTLPDALAASCCSGNSDTELEADSTPVTQIESYANESPSHEPKQKTFHFGITVPDSQETAESQQLSDQECANAHAQEFSTHQSCQDEQEHTLSIVFQTGTNTDPVIMNSSSDTSSISRDVRSRSQTVKRCSKRRHELPKKDRPIYPKAYAPSSAPVRAPSREQNALCHGKEPNVAALPRAETPEQTLPSSSDPNQRPATLSSTKGQPSLVHDDSEDFDSKANKLEDLTKELGKTYGPVLPAQQKHRLQPLPAEESSAPFTASLDESASLVVPAADRRELFTASIVEDAPPENPDSGTNVATGPKGQEVSTSEEVSTSKETSLKAGGLPAVIKKSLLDGSPPFEKAATDDAGRPSNSIATTSQIFERVEIPKLSPEKPVTPPRTLLPAQEESLRKIQPFSLILPTIGSPTALGLEQSKSHYLRALDKKYRLTQGVVPSCTASTVVDKPALETIQSREPTASPTAAPVEMARLAQDSSPSGYVFDMDVAAPEAVPDRRQSAKAIEDEDDLQLLMQPAVAPIRRKYRRYTASSNTTQLPLRPRIQDENISDDELSTPIKAIQDRSEMTPLRLQR
ncbi:MAG: hypothetical protein Q9166_001615 [cf. Caloplaca sp. 2 TL-2023]